MNGPPQAGTPRRIVLAEDEAIIRLDVRETLEAMGHEVLAETGRGDEAIGLIDQYQPDIALLDIKMPGRDGLSVAREIAETDRCAVLVLTAFSQADLVKEAANAGVLAYLVKPFQANELMASVEVACARFEQMRQLAAERDELAERLETRKVIDRAKGMLIDSHAMSEADAFGFIQRSAMSGREPMRDVANRILDGTLVPGAATTEAHPNEADPNDEEGR